MESYECNKQIEEIFNDLINSLNKRKSILLKRLAKISQDEKKKLNHQSNVLQQQYSISNKVKQ